MTPPAATSRYPAPTGPYPEYIFVGYLRDQDVYVSAGGVTRVRDDMIMGNSSWSHTLKPKDAMPDVCDLVEYLWAVKGMMGW